MGFLALVEKAKLYFILLDQYVLHGYTRNSPTKVEPENVGTKTLVWKKYHLISPKGNAGVFPALSSQIWYTEVFYFYLLLSTTQAKDI